MAYVGVALQGPKVDQDLSRRSLASSGLLKATGRPSEADLHQEALWCDLGCWPC